MQRILQAGQSAGPPVKVGYRPAFVLSLVSHLTAAVLVVLLTSIRPSEPTVQDLATVKPPERLVWLVSPGAGGGGGGGGTKSLQPAPQLQRPGRDIMSAPRPSPPPSRQVEQSAPEPPPLLEAPLRDLSSATTLVAGVLEQSPGVSVDERGPGDAGGAGPGKGAGIGSGAGAGLDRGRDGGFGDGVHRGGSGVSEPILIHQVRPSFTSQAMQARIGGVAVLDCVVTADGRIGDVRLVRSVDSRFGLDEQAVLAVKQWRFRPGMLAGQPVAVLVRVELAFTLH